ncbi:MAG: hypothetical protein E7490_02295 [Ruminococcaceae bacterium]|nr:hypothetical protein [Oscillospiraceae bacterium]
MKILVKVLKVLLVISVGVIALTFNVLGAISTLCSEGPILADKTGDIIFWLVLSAVCYVPPAFLVMFKKYILSATFTFVGMICVFVLHERLDGTGAPLYLPLILITILAILLAIFGNWNKIYEGIDKREAKKNAVAPSVLGGTTKSMVEQKKKSNNKNKK